MNRTSMAFVASAMLMLATHPLYAQSGKTGTVKIGSEFELSGDFIDAGLPPATALRMAVKEVNDAGGFTVGDTTYKIQLIDLDDKGQTASAVSGVTQLVEDDKVKFVFGPVLGALAAQAAEITIPAKVIHITPSAVWQSRGYLTDPTKPLLFDTQLPFKLVASADADALKQLGVTKVAFLSLDDDTTKANLSGFLDAMKIANIQVDPILFPTGTQEFSSYITRAKSNGDEAIYFLYPQGLAPDLIRTTIALNAAPKGFGARSMDPAVVLKGIDLKTLPMPYFTTFNTPSFDYPATPKMKAFTERIKAFAPTLHSPSMGFTLFTYDYLFMLIEAMKKAGSVDDTAKIGQEFASLTYDGVAGRICFLNGVRIAVTDGGQVFVRNGKIESHITSSACK